MRDFYEALGIQRTAQANEIKAAFKRLAKLYHPDRNPGNREAEEKFKQINEAYHTLIDPVKKSNYDLKLYGLLVAYDDNNVWHEQTRRRNYQWQRTRPATEYRFDKNYFKIQGLAFLVFLIIAGFSFGVIHTAHYYVRKQYMEKMMLNYQMLKQVNGLFGEGRYTDALTLIDNLQEEDPLDFRFGYAKDSLVDALRKRADTEYQMQDFNSAITHYKILKEYERPLRFETLENMSMCQYYLGEYEQSLQALKHLHNQEPHNLALIYQIAVINMEKLNNMEEALHYFTLGKKVFKQNLTHVYGEAFQIVMNPNDAPDIYYYLFMGRARANFKLKHYKESITDYNWAIFLRSHQPDPYYLRAVVAIYNKGTNENICEDLTRAQQLGEPKASYLKEKYCQPSVMTDATVHARKQP